MDSRLSRLHEFAFVAHRWASLAIAVASYSVIVLVFGGALAVSANYFVILPVLVAGLGFGMIGGSIAGSLGLPANLLLFGLLGHPEFSPASKLIAEISGVGVGFVCGYLADYFRELEREIATRVAAEEALRSSLAEKELLLREVHHRVKNNLNVIKSLVQLQRNRAGDPAVTEAADELIGRIIAISLVHNQLGGDPDAPGSVQGFSAVDPASYIGQLVSDFADAHGLDRSRIELCLGSGGTRLPVDSAISLGLIANEVLTNAIKHALGPSEAPRSTVSLGIRFGLEDRMYKLEIRDDGPGPSASRDSSGDLGQVGDGLGLKLVRALSRSLRGVARLEDIEGPEGVRGARFTLEFPSSDI